MSAPRALWALALAFLLAACAPRPPPSCAAAQARQLVADTAAAHCTLPSARDRAGIVRWTDCVLTAVRAGRALAAPPLFVATDNGAAVAYVATGPDRIDDAIGPCARVVLNESVPGTIDVMCGTAEYNPFSVPVAYPRHDEQVLVTMADIQARFMGEGPDPLPVRALVLDLPAGIEPAAGVCRHRGLQFPNGGPEGICGLLGPPGAGFDASFEVRYRCDAGALD